MYDRGLFTLGSPSPGRRNTKEIPPLGAKSTQQGHEGSETIVVYDYIWCGTTSGMTRNLQYLSTVDMDHKRCKFGPKKPQNYIVHPMLVPVVSHFFSYPAFKCLQYHPMPQTCVCGDRHAKAYL